MSGVQEDRHTLSGQLRVENDDKSGLIIHLSFISQLATQTQR